MARHNHNLPWTMQDRSYADKEAASLKITGSTTAKIEAGIRNADDLEVAVFAQALGSVWLKFQSQRMMQATCTAAKNWCPRFS